MNSIDMMFFNQPWALQEDVLKSMTEIVLRHTRGEKLSEEEIEARTGARLSKQNGSYELVGSTAVIPVYGIIAKRASMVNGISQPSGTSTEAIRDNLRAAIADERVKDIVLSIDSPGGSVAGVTELSDYIYSLRGIKPITAYADGMMASAAYHIGSAADRILASRSSEVGSIGVYSVLYDLSVMNHNMGVKTEIIKAGRYKAAGHPDKPMTEEDKAVVRENVNAFYNLFVSAVARNRNMSMETALEIANGKVFIGQDAIDAGLVDAIGEVNTFLDASSAASSQGAAAAVPVGVEIENEHHKTTEEEKEMDLKSLTMEALKAARPDLCEALIAEGKTAEAQALKNAEAAAEKKGHAEGDKTERARVTDILEGTKDIPGVEAARNEAITTGDTPEAAVSRCKDARLAALETKAPKASGPGEEEHVEVSGNAPLEKVCEQEWNKSVKLQKEFPSFTAYKAFRKAESEGRVKIK